MADSRQLSGQYPEYRHLCEADSIVNRNGQMLSSIPTSSPAQLRRSGSRPAPSSRACASAITRAPIAASPSSSCSTASTSPATTSATSTGRATAAPNATPSSSTSRRRTSSATSCSTPAGRCSTATATPTSSSTPSCWPRRWRTSIIHQRDSVAASTSSTPAGANGLPASGQMGHVQTILHTLESVEPQGQDRDRPAAARPGRAGSPARAGVPDLRLLRRRRVAPAAACSTCGFGGTR